LLQSTPYNIKTCSLVPIADRIEERWTMYHLELAG
jgi:hypothetical protein